MGWEPIRGGIPKFVHGPLRVFHAPKLDVAIVKRSVPLVCSDFARDNLAIIGKGRVELAHLNGCVEVLDTQAFSDPDSLLIPPGHADGNTIELGVVQLPKSPLCSRGHRT